MRITTADADASADGNADVDVSLRREEIWSADEGKKRKNYKLTSLFYLILT